MWCVWDGTVQYSVLLFAYLFSLRNVWMIELTVVLPILGCTLRPASSMVRPWLTTWSTIVALISLGIRLYLPLLPLPLPLPPRILTPLPRCWPSILCHRSVEMVHTSSCAVYICLPIGDSQDSSIIDSEQVVCHWLQLNFHTPPHVWQLWFTWDQLFNSGDISRKNDTERYRICLTDGQYLACDN